MNEDTKYTFSKNKIAGKAIFNLKQNIVALWEERVRERVPASENISSPVLINHLPNFLDHLSNALVNSELTHTQISKDASEHAIERAHIPSYTLEQVLLEYRLLRQALIEIINENGLLQKETIQIIDDAIDEAIAKAAKEFLVSEIDILHKKAGIQEKLQDKKETPEARLAQSNEGLRLLIDAVKDYAIYMMDTKGIVISWNEGARRIKGYTAEEILGQHFSKFYTQESINNKIPEEELRLAEQYGSHEDEGWRLRKDGNMFWANVVITPIYDRSKKLLGFAKVIRDLTEQRKKEEQIQNLNTELELKLAAATNELRNILEAAGEGIYGLDDQGKATFINKAASKMLKWEGEEFIGKNVHGLIHHSRSDLSPYPVDECPIYSSLRDGLNHFALEDVLWRKDGTSFPAEYSSSPIFHGNKIVGAVVVFRDITERKKVLETIQNQQAWLNEILDRLPTLVMLVEASTGNVRFINAAVRNAAFSVPRSLPTEEDAETYYATDLSGNRIKRSEMPRFRVARGEAIHEFEMNWYTPEGVVNLLINGVFMSAKYGQPATGILTFEDITQRKKYELKLQQALSAREQVLGIVSHDLRNPLGAILMNANLLEHKFSEEEFIHKMAIKIKNAGNRMNEIIEDLLNLAKIESGQFEIIKEQSCGRELLSEAVELLRPIAEKKHIHIEMAENKTPLNFLCDHVKLLRVFTNLIHNAIKFTPEHGKIKVSSEDKISHYLFGISDTGPGITTQQLPHVFDRFWQAKDTAHLGTGLGLSISKGIVEAHGGKIWAESKFGHGATFFFTLPKKV